MSGPSSEQLQLQDEQMQFYQQGIQQSKTTFKEQQSLIDMMKSVYEPILARGPQQEGFAGAEKEALESQATEGTARNYAAASRAVNRRMAASGGDNTLTSGGETEVRAEIASSAAGELSREQQQITEADYAQGEHNFENATSAIENASAQLNPVGFETAATGAGSAAETTAKDINAEQNSWMAPVFGAIGAIGGGIATGGMSNLGQGKGFFG
jgi:hypothetical protein